MFSRNPKALTEKANEHFLLDKKERKKERKKEGEKEKRDERERKIKRER